VITATQDSGDITQLRLELPQRSRLYGLPPIGSGTEDIESATGYISRLALAHCVPVGVLIRDEMSPLLSSIGIGGRPSTSLTWKIAHAMNGVGEMARETVTRLEALTGLTDLRFLTMAPWSAAIPPRSLLRRKRAWCTHCYRMWAQEQAENYDPLIWAIDAVTVCLHHRQPLRTRCANPSCGRPQPVLAFNARPGFCVHCGMWLGEDSPDEWSGTPDDRVDLGSADIAWHVNVASLIGQVLASGPTFSDKASRGNVMQAFSRLAGRGSKNRIPKLATSLGLSAVTVKSWRQGQRIPTLTTLAYLCASLGLSPLHILTNMGGEDAPQPHVAGPIPIIAGKEERQATWKRFDSAAVHQHLEMVLTADTDEPLPMAVVARSMGYHHQYLQTRFPKLCAAISARYLSYRRRRSQERMHNLQSDVRNATITLHQQGIYPSEERVILALGGRADFRAFGIHTAWCETMAKLRLPLHIGMGRD